MNLPPDKARLLRQYDNEKKWDLICDQVWGLGRGPGVGVVSWAGQGSRAEGTDCSPGVLEKPWPGLGLSPCSLPVLRGLS